MPEDRDDSEDGATIMALFVVDSEGLAERIKLPEPQVLLWRAQFLKRCAAANRSLRDAALVDLAEAIVCAAAVAILAAMWVLNAY